MQAKFGYTEINKDFQYPAERVRRATIRTTVAAERRWRLCHREHHRRPNDRRWTTLPYYLLPRIVYYRRLVLEFQRLTSKSRVEVSFIIADCKSMNVTLW